MTHIVTAPLVIVRAADGTDRYLYRGVPVPADIPADHVRPLVELGMVKVGTTADVTAASAEIQTPAKAANHAAWIEYAISQGVPAEDAAKTTKKDLVARYLGDTADPPSTTAQVVVIPGPGDPTGFVDTSVVPPEDLGADPAVDA